MNSKNNSPIINPMSRQNVYISPRLNMTNKKYYLDTSDDSVTSSEVNTASSFSSNDSLSSFEDYRVNLDYYKKEDANVGSSSSMCNGGFIYIRLIDPASQADQLVAIARRNPPKASFLGKARIH